MVTYFLALAGMFIGGAMSGRGCGSRIMYLVWGWFCGYVMWGM